MSNLLFRLWQWEQQYRVNFERKIMNTPNLNTLSVMELCGLRLWLRVRSWGLRWAIRNGQLKPPEGLTALMNLALAPGDVFVDIGANIGAVTERAAYLVSHTGQIYSFEPSPSSCRHLRQRIAHLGLKNVVINEFALGDVPGTGILHEFREGEGAVSSLRSGAWPGHQHTTETKVAIQTLDDYLSRNQIGPIRLMKIDVQGAEIDVLRGSSRLLASPQRPILFVELERDTNAAFGRTVNDLLAIIAGFGYQTFSWRKYGLVAVCSESNIPDNGHDDVICLDLNLNEHSQIHEQIHHLAERHK